MSDPKPVAEVRKLIVTLPRSMARRVLAALESPGISFPREREAVAKELREWMERK